MDLHVEFSSGSEALPCGFGAVERGVPATGWLMRAAAAVRRVFGLLSILLPWPLRRWVLTRVFGYRIHPTSRIGFSWVFPRQLEMEAHSYIRQLTVFRGLDRVYMGPHAKIGNANWITAYPSRSSVPIFEDYPDRAPELILEEGAGITTRHYIDCTDSVVLGRLSLIAGVRTVLLTHSVDLGRAKQACAAVRIGAHCHVGTNCVVLPGTSLPPCSVLGANSLLNRSPTDSYRLYAGSPARDRGELDRATGWFTRTERP